MAKTNIKKIMKTGILADNPVTVQVIGICSTLAVTNRMLNSLIMGVALAFVTAFSSMTVSLIKEKTPKHIRMMVQVLIIAAYVILVDIFLKAYMPEMSKALGPYVGLIITNCIIMGRAEAFAISNPPVASFFDGLAAGAGYSLVLMIVSFVREILGFGSVFGIQILPESMTQWTMMIMPAGAFFILALIIWFSTSHQLKKKGAEPK
ncbi:MAG: NADH:ubiquinone reductase (Na(+)-transporting) subunit D [Tissierellia bacterium]|nr:NADH:ubiquinone reductase (Na(+)-transporting) subunit D [Tissierellia bacterium]